MRRLFFCAKKRKESCIEDEREYMEQVFSQNVQQCRNTWGTYLIYCGRTAF